MHKCSKQLLKARVEPLIKGQSSIDWHSFFLTVPLDNLTFLTHLKQRLYSVFKSLIIRGSSVYDAFNTVRKC